MHKPNQYSIMLLEIEQIGRALMNKAIEIAKLESAEWIWLGVWEKNHRAVRFYQKNGFQIFDKHIFQFGSDAQTDFMMKKKV